MRNYRNISKALSYINTLSQKSIEGMTHEQMLALILDIQPLSDTNYSYTVKEKGTLFIMGFIKGDMPFPDMDVLVKRNFSRVESTRFLPRYYQSIILKKNVSVGETFTLPEVRGTVILCKENCFLNNYLYSLEIAEKDGTMNFKEIENVFGYFMINCISLQDTLSFLEGDNMLLSNEPNYGHTFGFSRMGKYNFKLNTITDGWFPMALSLIEFKQSITEDVKYIEDIGVSIERMISTEVSVGSKVYNTLIGNGTIIFIGSYRISEAFPLSKFGFTILEQHTTTTGGITQIYVIAIKEIQVNESYVYSTTDRHGGNFYETKSKIKNRTYSIGMGAKITNNITMRNPNKNKLMLGIVGSTFSSTYGTNISNSQNVITKMNIGGYHVGFCANDHFNRFYNEINFNYTAGTWNGSNDEIISMYIEF